LPLFLQPQFFLENLPWQQGQRRSRLISPCRGFITFNIQRKKCFARKKAGDVGI
jgi:hypothetical protein